MGKMKNSVKTLFLIALTVLALTSVGTALDYPTKPIQIIVPHPPGGTTDLTARIMAPKLSSILGQPVVTVNKPGGGGALGNKLVATSKPDGYTILISPPGIILVPILHPRIGYRFDDFVAVCQATSTIYVIVVKSDSPWKTLDDLIKDAKKNPGKLTHSSAGIGTAFHFVSEFFKIETGTDMVHVPMGGEALAVTGVLGGQVNMNIAGLGAVSGHLKAGTIRALALLYPKRMKSFPDIPTIKELGYPSLSTIGWYGYFVPAKTPEEIVKKLGKAFETVMKDKEVIEGIEKADMLAESSTLEEAAKFFQSEEKRWTEVARKARIEVTGTGK